MKGLPAFISGAAIGAGIVYLLKSDDCRGLRRSIRNFLRKKGLIESSEVDELVDLIALQIDTDNRQSPNHKDKNN